MLQVSGEIGELWWMGDPASVNVPLESRDGWEWGPRDPSLRWWASSPMVLDDGEFLVTDSTSQPNACVVTRRCLKGHLLSAMVVAWPLSLALTAPEWTLQVEMKEVPKSLGVGAPPVARGDTGAVLRGLEESLALTPPNPSEMILARLRHGQAAFQGVCTVRDTQDGLSLLFKDGVVYDRC